MAIKQFEKNMDIIAQLSDSPNVDEGLTASQLKSRFDEGGKAIKDYINNTLLQQVAEQPKFLGLMKSDGTAIQQAVPGEDYQPALKEGTVRRDMLAEDVTAAALGGAQPAVCKTVTLSAEGWADKEQSVAVSGLTAESPVVITPAAESYVAYVEGMVRCVAQSNGSLRFRCEDVPQQALAVNVLIVG